MIEIWYTPLLMSMAVWREWAILVHGSITIRDLRHRLNLDFGEEDNKTLSGLILEKLEHIPEPCESPEYHGYKLTVETMRRQKIAQIKIALT